MNPAILEIISCPGCGSYPLELTTFEAGRDDVIESGFLRCHECRRLFFIIEGIPRLITEEFSELVAATWAMERQELFAGRPGELDEFLNRVRAPTSRSAATEWNVDDVAFWEEDVYSEPDQLRAYLDRAGRSRPDAGHRTYPREKYIFSHIRADIRGKRIVDHGCGYAQTIRALCEPRKYDYGYVGADLAINALLANRRTLAGEFVQCSANALPFRRESIDISLCLGTLHHLHEPTSALERMIETVKPGGYLGLHEVIRRRRSERPNVSESTHNAAIDAHEALAVLQAECDLVDVRFESSPVRGLAVSRLGEAMRTRPWLTRAIIGADDAIIASLGRLSPLFSSRAMLALARKRDHSSRGSSA